MEDFRLEGPACAAGKREAEKDWGSKRCLSRCDRLASHRRLNNTLWITPSAAANGRLAVSTRNEEALRASAGFGRCSAFSPTRPTCTPMAARRHLRPQKQSSRPIGGNGSSGRSCANYPKWLLPAIKKLNC